MADSDNAASYGQNHHDSYRRRRIRYEEDDDLDDSNYSQARSKNRRRESPIDRISALPDCLLLHILSFLPIEDAIRTDVLSKRWQYVWTYLPSLLFCFDDSVNPCDRCVNGDFVEFVDKTLILCNGSTVKKIGVDFYYHDRFVSNVNVWTRFAARNDTEELRLKLPTYNEDWNELAAYVLPQHLYTNSSFRELSFSWCRVMPKAAVNWKSLNKLSIGFVKLSDDAIQKILVGSPVLEILELYHFCGVNRLHGINASVKKLILREVWNLDRGEACDFDRRNEDLMNLELEILMPNLQSLEILGGFELRYCRLVDATSLVEATLNFNLRRRESDKLDDYERHINTLRELLESLENVKNITLGTWAIQVLSIMEAKSLPSPLLKCERLMLDTGYSKLELPGIVNLLESSNSLETLVITMSSCNCQYFRDTLTKVWNLYKSLYGTSPKRTCKGLKMYLKKVEFSGLRQYQLDYIFPLAQSLLMIARVLQKMVITMRGEGSDIPKEVFQAAQKLLSFPRSSSDAIVMFYA
ncbi:hypothetical protein U1Q18_009091 [Sarracenia purpurea var. burkii]